MLPLRIIRENIRFNRNQEPGQIIGTLPIYQTVQGIDLAAGRFLSYADEKYKRNVCVITEDLATRLFPYQDPLESTVRVQQDYYQVVGLARETGTEEQRPQKRRHRWRSPRQQRLHPPLHPPRPLRRNHRQTLLRILLGRTRRTPQHHPQNGRHRRRPHRRTPDQSPHRPLPRTERLGTHRPPPTPPRSRGHQAHVQHRPRLHRRHLPPRRRHRHHEHHARHRHRTHPRDRRPPRPRRQAQRHRPTVPHRDHRPLRRRRPHRRRPRHPRARLASPSSPT